MMKVAINCRSFLNKQYTGIGRYAFHLVKSLTKIDSENEYLLYAKRGILSTHKKLPRFNQPNFFLKVDRFNEGIDKILGKVDIYHSPSPDSLNVNSGAKIIVTVHDLIFKTFPQGHTQRTVDDTERQFNEIAQRATKIICCSQNTINDLKKYFNVDSNKISLVYQGVDKSIFYPLNEFERKKAERLLRKKGINEPYILSVGTIEPRKNLTNILHAFEKIKTKKQFNGKLVVVGMKGWMSDGIYNIINKLELKNDVIFLGYIDDKELKYFYNKAEAFVFPSFYEGFGFPIIEAFSCAVPVITSSASSCPEVANGAALITNPYDSVDIANAVARVINDRKLKISLIEKGLTRADDFCFEKTARKTLEVYKEVYNQ